MAQLALRAGIACYVAGVITALAGVAAVFDTPVPSLSTVAAVAVAAGLVTAAVLPWRFDLTFDPRTESHPLGVSLLAGLFVGLSTPVSTVFIDAPFSIETLLVFGGLATLLGSYATTTITRRVWIARRRTQDQRVVDIERTDSSQWRRRVDVAIFVIALVSLVVAVHDRSYSSITLFISIGGMMSVGSLFLSREAVFETGLLDSMGGVPTFTAWDTFDGYTIDGETLRLRRGRDETTVDLSRAADPNMVRSIVADHLPGD